ncbi:transposase [Pseudovibrio sp. Ad37]|uniref:transposase n=1 Tax=Pseudovibrio sp. Ad37 TaxID=989422 RepID=UPI0007B23A4B|nr:transposase [Pseudovibrio sp. Ad37]KZL22340.1 Transposase [Pseudovibrio sp. Ad37]
MGQNTKTASVAAERMVKDIRRKARKRYSTEDKIRIVLAGLRGEDCIAELCRQEGLSQGLYYSWSKEFWTDLKKMESLCLTISFLSLERDWRLIA